MKRTGFMRRTYTPPPAAPLCALVRPVNYARIDDTARAAPKPVEQRNQHLLAMARGQRCLLSIPGVCMGNTETTVACHSNLGAHGKAGARKADDQYSVWGCMACHRWLDQGPAQYDEKAAAFMRALVRQILEWRKIVADMVRTPRDRKAAHWALCLLDGVPMPGEVPDQAEVAVMDDSVEFAVEKKKGTQ